MRQPPSSLKDIRISALALLKMVMHARSGGNLEVMGLLLGKVISNTNIITNEIKLVYPTLFVSFMKGRLERDGGDGLVRAAGGGDGDAGQRAGAGLRVHDGVHRGGQKGNDFSSLCTDTVPRDRSP